MPTLLQRLFDTNYDADLREAKLTAKRLDGAIGFFEEDRTYLKESLTELMIQLEDYKWDRIDGWEDDKGFPIDWIQDKANKIRPLLTINPTIKKAINARVGYIHGQGVSFKGTGLNKLIDDDHNQEILFSDAAKWQLESLLATDGNVWAARDSRNNNIILVPIDQIGGWIVDDNDPTRVTYWLRAWSVRRKNFRTGIVETEDRKEWYPAVGTTGTVRTIDEYPVNRSMTMVHAGANKQADWILGVPDILAAMFWAKGHKELFESGTAFVKAQGRFASKVTAKSQAGAQRAAAAVAGAPRRDPESGEVLDIGGTAVMSAGLDMQLMGKMSGGVDFEAFDPVAGLVAVGLGVPRDVILGTADGEEKSLEQTTVDEMRLRQKLWTRFFQQLFAPRKVEVIWPKIKTEPTYRQIQSIELSNRTGTLEREELRQLTLEAYGIAGDPAKLPEVEDNFAYLLAKAVADNAAKNTEKATEKAAELAPTVPEQGVDAEIGKLSTGPDSKDARNDKSDRNTKNE